MTGKEKLSEKDVSSRMSGLSGWEHKDGKLHKQFEFASFPEAFGFMATVAIHAQATGHHPDWCNSYTKVTVDLSSHDVGGLSERDFKLAALMDRLARGLV
jgi:4a-hydroxytetrahydrobiopterin dehydratase